MEIKFNSDHNLPLNKPLKFDNMTTTIRSVFEENGKLYPQIFLDDTLYELNVQKMLEFDRIDVSEGIDVNKTILSKTCEHCYYWFFKDVGFKHQKYLCNGCHDLMQKPMNFDNVAIVYVKEMLTELIFGIWANMMQLTQWMVLIWLIKEVFYNFFLVYIKIEWKCLFNLSSKKPRRDTK